MHKPTEASYLREHAARCRRLAAAISDGSVAATLRSIAKQHEVRAAESETASTRAERTLKLMLRPEH